MIMDYTVQLDLDCFSSHADLINQLQPIINAKKDEEVIIDIRIGYKGKIVYPDQMLLAASAIIDASNRGVNIRGDVLSNKFCEGYVSRMNFYEHLRVISDENFIRRDSNGKFLEITRFSDIDNERLSLITQIKNIFMSQQIHDDNLLASIDLALSELICNIDHAQTNEGWITAQYFPKKRKIRIMIADTGIGIHKGLTDNPQNPEYKLFTPSQSIGKCIEKGVTNGRGGGRGLHIVHNLIKENGGALSIYSGNEQLHVSKHNIKNMSGGYWSGTCVFLEILSHRSVDILKINGGSTDFYDLHMDNKDGDWFL